MSAIAETLQPSDVQADATQANAALTRDNGAERQVNRSSGFLVVLGVFALGWYLLNMISFVAVSVAPPDFIANRYTPEQFQYLASLPSWSLLMSGLVVGFGIVASIALMMRREEAYFAFMLSLLLAIGHLLDSLGRGAFHIMSAGDAASSVALLFFSLFLFWAAHDARNHGQLK